MQSIVTHMLYAIGENPRREGLIETPARVEKAWKEWFKGYNQDPADLFKTFEDGAKNCNEMVIVKDIPFYSHCEHHCAPFFGVAHVAYIPAGRVIGISKIARLVDLFASRLQIQERLTTQVAETMMEQLEPLGVAVMIEAQHLCMSSRGIKKPGAKTITSALRGCFRNESSCRAEFYSLVKG